MNGNTNANKVKMWRRVLLLLAVVVTVLAVAVTCALTLDSSKTVSVDSADDAEVQTSTTYTAGGDYSAAAKLRNGDIFNFTSATSYTLTLPKGQYKIEAYGAQGGNGYGTIYGGYGGYSYGTLTLTDAKTVVYVTVGGKGSNYGARTSAASGGGYNGGGNARGSNATGGGGASDVRIGSNAVNYRILVAGGGGGGGYNTTSYRYKGVGGGSTGGNAINTSHTAYAYGLGGSQTAGGGHSSSTYYSYSSYGECGTGTFGSGGVGIGRTTGGAGGGGGWYGGGGGCYFGGGGGGSGFVLTTSVTSSTAALPTNYFGSKTSTANYYKYRMTGAATTTSTHTGVGSVKITVVDCNLEPVTKNYNVPTVKARANSGIGISIAASSLAQDPDSANYGGAATNVYFSAGTSSNYDTAPANDAGLFLDAACTKNANTYLSYSWSGGTATSRTTLTINAIKKLPRAGVDGQADKKFTLYTKIRDNFGSSTTRKVAVISFTMSVTDNAIAVQGAKTKVGTYKFGASTKNSQADGALNYAEIQNNQYINKDIYNPTGLNRTTLFIPKPISPTDTAGYTIRADELFSDADTAFDKVAFKSLTVVTGWTGYVNAASYYSLTLNSDSTYATGLFPSFTLKPSGVRPAGSPYVVMQITAQTSETASKAAIGSTNTTVYLVFRISNTRPYIGSTDAVPNKFAEPSVTLKAGESKQLKLKDMVYDLDDAANLKATFAQELKVPTNEFIEVDSSNTAVKLVSSVNGKASNYYNKTSVNTTAGKLSSVTGEGTTATYFNTNAIAAKGSNGESTANVTYRYVDTQTIEFTGRAATQNQYRKTDGTADTTRTGHFYVLVRLIDPSDPSDNGIWFPIAIEVTGTAPTEPATFANATLDFTDYSAGSNTSNPTKGVGDFAYFTPISYVDSNGVLQGIGQKGTDTGSEQAIPFALDTDGFMGKYNTQTTTALNDFVYINGSTEADVVLDNDAATTGTFFKVELFPLYAPKTVFNLIPTELLAGYGVTSYNETYNQFYGLRVTGLRSTNGEYFQFRVKVKDTHGNVGQGEGGTVSICIKVENRAVAASLAPTSERNNSFKINALLDRNKVTPYGSYEKNDNLGSEPRVNYTIEVLDKVQITPYDFAFDFDTDPNVGGDGAVINAGKFNSNPLNEGFEAFSEYVLKTYNIAHTELPATSAAQKAKSAVSHQKLDFANRANITAYGEQYGNYIGVQVNDTTEYIKTNEDGTATKQTVAIPSILISGVTRTTSSIIQMSFSISDGFTNITCYITVTVINSAPMLNTEQNHPTTTGDTKRIQDYYNLTAFTDAMDAVMPNVRTFTSADIAYDKDGDSPMFDASSLRVVAKSGNAYYSELYYANGLYYTEQRDERTKINLSDYVGVSIAKGSNGEDVLRIQGLSSTEIFSWPIYVEFKMDDGYRAQPQSAVLHLLVNVVNSKPYFVTDNLLEIAGEDQYNWQIDYEVASELKQERYIFNSRELYEGMLYDGDSRIYIASKNKVYLFDDYDQQQHALLNPNAFAESNYISTALVQPYENRTDRITRSLFDTYNNAAVIYTPMYEHNGSGSGLNDRGFIDVKVLSFTKNPDGTFTKLAANSPLVKDCEYWALELKDTHAEGKRSEVQFAISIKDNHHNKTLYKKPDKLEQNSTANESDLTVLNFYYSYSVPGIMAMHTYYRTDGNTEAKILADEEGKYFLIDQAGMDIGMFDDSVDASVIEQFKSGDAATRQKILETVKFKPEFRYRYFERTYETVENGTTVTKLTYKHFADSTNPFAYSPIVIARSSTGSKEVVPMSYIALPKGAEKDTEHGTHVTFANAGSTLSPTNVLLDKNYADWQFDNAALANVYKNITISDGTNKYSVEENPYINVRYVANTASNKIITSTNKYLNKDRFKINENNLNGERITDTNYREDQYGFEISKKDDGPRSVGTLKMTIALKPLGEREGSVEMVDVEINLLNSSANRLEYYSRINTNDQNFIHQDSYRTFFAETTVDMTMSDTSQSSMTLVNITEAKKGADVGSVGKIFYQDPDSTDTMKFYMPSAFVSKTVEGGETKTKSLLTDAELTFILSDITPDSVPTKIQKYYNVSNNKRVSLEEARSYEPNPGYDTFFSVSPAAGSSDVIQFIPKAKTQISSDMTAEQRAKYLNEHHLLEESEGGKIYYPFRILFYDECRGSAFTRGYWYTAIIRVYIDNDPIKVNTTLTEKVDYNNNSTKIDEKFRGKKIPKYKVSISGNTKFYVDVSSLLIDEDILIKGDGYFVTSEDKEWTDLKVEDRAVVDCLIMPVKEGAVKYVDLTAQESGNTSMPFTVTAGNSGNGLPYTTIVFETKSAFKQERNLGFEFSDSNGAPVQIVFAVTYNNDAPTPNSDTFGGSNVIDVTLRTNESFYLYATDYTLFENDKDGGFTSYTSMKNAYESQGLPKNSAQSMAESFKYFTSVYDTASAGKGDSLVLASDDAPTTLRITGVAVADGSGRTIQSIANYLTVVEQISVNRETNDSTVLKGNLRVQISAKGAISTVIAVTLVDAAGLTVVVNVKITVLSTAPTPVTNTKNLPDVKIVPGETNTYEIELKYNKQQAISLRYLMDDIDFDDLKTLDVYTSMSGEQFTVENRTGDNAVVSVEVSKESSAYNHVLIKAIDFISQTGDDAYATVKFRVVDINGAVSDTVTIRVKIVPEPVTTVIASNKSLPVKVMGYDEYVNPDNASEPQELKLVENDKATLFKDPDVNASSAAYNVEVFVLLKKNDETGVYNAVNYDPNGAGNILLYSRDAKGESFGYDDEAYYVQNFFTVSVSADGKILYFTPNSTIANVIPLYIKISKRSSGNSTSSTVGAKVDVTVNNSRLKATENSSLNVGYPMVAGSKDLRDSQFLSFTGSKGDSLTWKLYDLENTELGLYYDYDMLNMASVRDNDKSIKKDYIKYIGYEYKVANETSSGFGSVLNVSVTGEGANQKLTITINRNVFKGQPSPSGEENKPYDIDVYIYAVDAANDTAATINDKDKVTATVIKVSVTNDKPEIDVTGIVTVCPNCGKDTVVQKDARTAQCSSCNNTFKSLNPDQLGYTLSHDDESGYVLNTTLENGKFQDIYIKDIIDDADIDMDVYVMLNTGADGSLMGRDNKTVPYVRANEENAFSVEYETNPNAFNVSTLSYIRFTCRSVVRGAVGVCSVKFRDSYVGCETSILTIRLTVGNTEPAIKPGANTSFTIMGVGKSATDAAVEAAGRVFNILDFITDVNGDNFDPTDAKNANRTPTYTYIDEIQVFTTSDDSVVNRPEIYGPNLLGEMEDEDTGQVEVTNTVDTVCAVTWLEDDPTHQKFRIEPTKGIYGVQKFRLSIYDSGFEDGLAAGIYDGKRFDLVLTVTVANPLDDVPEVLESKDMVYGVTRTILAKDLLGDDNAKGYTISKIEEINGTHNLRILSPEDAGEDGSKGEWRIYAYTESVSATVKITFITGDGTTRERTMPITIVANNKPELKNGISKYRYTVSMLEDKEQRTIRIRPTDWFEDRDAEDVMTFITPVSSSQTVKVEAIHMIGTDGDDSNSYILLTFNRRGESVITVTLTDLSGRSYTYSVTVECTDAPELSWWEDFVSLIEANWMWFWIAVGAFVVLLVVLIVVIVVVHKKRKMRREIEALLESETELEQEMIRLQSGAAAFQSFGYLPPMQQNINNPGMMLGSGAGAPQQNSLQLNAGTGPSVNNIPNGTPPNAPPQTPFPPSGDGFDPNDF